MWDYLVMEQVERNGEPGITLIGDEVWNLGSICIGTARHGSDERIGFPLTPDEHRRASRLRWELYDAYADGKDFTFWGDDAKLFEKAVEFELHIQRNHLPEDSSEIVKRGHELLLRDLEQAAVELELT